MLGHSLSGTNDANNRMFTYEVAGLHENDRTAQNQATIRHSATQSIAVPYNRMSEFMQRMHRLGGTIVGIRSGTAAASDDSHESHESHQSDESHD
jgi:phycocyanin-associated, rod